MNESDNDNDDGDDEELNAQVELKKLQLELDRCFNSINPLDWLKALWLEKRVNRAEKHKDQVQKREEKRMSEERKVINVVYVDSDNVVSDANTRISLSRDLLRNWEENEKILQPVDNTSNIIIFEDVEEGGTYYLSKKILTTNFDGYAKAEANRQAQDCAEAIRDGQILIPPFNQKGTKICYEYEIIFKKKLSDLRSPIRPDAILIHGSDWLVLEVKHDFTNSLLQRFAKVCDFIEKHRSERWVSKQHPVPKKIIRVACSKVGFSDVNCGVRGIIKLVNVNQTYKRVDDM